MPAHEEIRAPTQRPLKRRMRIENKILVQPGFELPIESLSRGRWRKRDINNLYL